jgi:DNA-binding MurR/RpiR family transcriptional regulator
MKLTQRAPHQLKGTVGGPLAPKLISDFDGMSSQLRIAARFILDRPGDVALLSMREQARRAGVQPATMTRLAKHLGLSGYDAVREMYVESVLEGEVAFASRADRQVANQKLKGEEALAQEMTDSLAAQIVHLSKPATRASFSAAAETLAAARRIYCLGLRASFSVAWHFHYVLSLVRDEVELLDGAGGTGLDRLRDAASSDVLLAVTVHPYTIATVEAVERAQKRGLRITVITDSPVAPVVDAAVHTLIVGTESASFLHSMTPCFAAAEILAALVAGRGGANAIAMVRRTDEQLSAFRTHVSGARRGSGA